MGRAAVGSTALEALRTLRMEREPREAARFTRGRPLGAAPTSSSTSSHWRRSPGRCSASGAAMLGASRRQSNRERWVGVAMQMAGRKQGRCCIVHRDGSSSEGFNRQRGLPYIPLPSSTRGSALARDLAPTERQMARVRKSTEEPRPSREERLSFQMGPFLLPHSATEALRSAERPPQDGNRMGTRPKTENPSLHDAILGAMAVCARVSRPLADSQDGPRRRGPAHDASPEARFGPFRARSYTQRTCTEGRAQTAGCTRQEVSGLASSRGSRVQQAITEAPAGQAVCARLSGRRRHAKKSLRLTAKGNAEDPRTRRPASM
ncbi:hypothetical protein VTK73DRAFT_2792 [Phialemonium thermophilum]|uniref:Uncharacterized protein n=1 Tax=Phialemonium thermophilum TaxID=223376 RepID=A0ABR3VRF6_9PEZI